MGFIMVVKDQDGRSSVFPLHDIEGIAVGAAPKPIQKGAFACQAPIAFLPEAEAQPSRQPTQRLAAFPLGQNAENHQNDD